jgi:23S rRNA A2030 N6-methylase RlmJ
MNLPEKNQTVEEILDDYVASVTQPNRDDLEAWVRRYPAYERELVEFTLNWLRMEHAPTPVAEPPATVEAQVQRGMEVVRRLMREAREAEPPPSWVPIADLVARGESLGLNRQALAAQLGLSGALITKLNRRLIAPASIPAEMITRLAQLLQSAEDAVAAYFQGAPRLAQGAHYRAEKAPAAGNQQDFFAAVANDAAIPADQREYWLRCQPRQH